MFLTQEGHRPCAELPDERGLGPLAKPILMVRFRDSGFEVQGSGFRVQGFELSS